MKLDFIYYFAISQTHTVTFAENSKIYRSLLQTFLTFISINLIYSFNPSLSITSALSRIIDFNEEKSIFPHSIWSFTLPLVPTNRSKYFLSWIPMEMELHTVLIKIIKINLQLKASSYYSINEKMVKKEMLNLSEYFIYNNFLKSLLH